MEKIIQIVTTPIALASLAILVFGVVLQRSNVRKDVVTGVFWLILILGVLAGAVRGEDRALSIADQW